ncbi:MAG: DNA alkylation repair protein [Defluviitaleaceae bacterium]|nr:DNA alkylation repair protein [Defluviitaleaceae bacterium]
MDELVLKITSELARLREPPNDNKFTTGEIRKIAALNYKLVKNERSDKVFYLCENLLKFRSWPEGVVAFDIANRLRGRYGEGTFKLFEGWLIDYVRGWGDCDDFCVHAFGELICRFPRLTDRTALWVSRDEFWMRRASAVVLILPIKRGLREKVNPFAVSDALIGDDDRLVRNGYSWMLKELSKREPDLVFDYLEKNKSIMPKPALRYAAAKLGGEMKDKLLRR